MFHYQHNVINEALGDSLYLMVRIQTLNYHIIAVDSVYNGHYPILLLFENTLFEIKMRK